MNKVLTNLPHTKFLGLVVDDTLTWNNHVDQLISRLNSACNAIIIIINSGTTAHFGSRPSSEAFAIRPYFLRHSSNVFPPASWHHPSLHNTFHEPILRSLLRFAGRLLLNRPAFASSDFATCWFSRAGCQPCVQPPAILEDRLDCFLVWIFITDQSGMGDPASSYATASIAP